MFSRTASNLRGLARPRTLARPVGRIIAGGAEKFPRATAAGLAVGGRRTFLNNYRARLAWEIETGNWKKYKIPIAIALSIWVITIASAGAAVYKYYEFVRKTMHNFPDSVAKELRRALYYGYNNNAQDCVRHFQAALKAAAEEGMDPLSDEVVGIKIELAGVLERFERRDKSVEVLNHVLDNIRGENLEEKYSGRDRTRLMKKAVQIQVKLGELYGLLGDDKKAGDALVWGIETMLRERKRREAEEVNIEEQGEWFTNEEVAHAFESLASYYDKTGQHQLATPLYLHALDLLPGKSCHAVILMNNIAASLSQSPPPPNLSRKDLIENSAKKWAEKALDIDANIKPPDRTEECDIGCAVTVNNLAEMAEILGEKEEAKLKFREALSLAKALGFKDGILRAEEGLKRTGENI